VVRYGRDPSSVASAGAEREFEDMVRDMVQMDRSCYMFMASLATSIHWHALPGGRVADAQCLTCHRVGLQFQLTMKKKGEMDLLI
jgi:hypothetical protein